MNKNKDMWDVRKTIETSLTKEGLEHLGSGSSCGIMDAVFKDSNGVVFEVSIKQIDEKRIDAYMLGLENKDKDNKIILSELSREVFSEDEDEIVFLGDILNASSD